MSWDHLPSLRKIPLMIPLLSNRFQGVEHDRGRLEPPGNDPADERSNKPCGSKLQDLGADDALLNELEGRLHELLVLG